MIWRCHPGLDLGSIITWIPACAGMTGFMKFDIITIFPKILNSYFKESILKRAQKNGLIEVLVHDLRDFVEATSSGRRTVDDKPFGGGPGMILKVEPIYKAVQFIKSKSKIKNEKLRNRTILLSAKGEKFSQKVAKRLSKYDQLIFICGRYEGVDERVAEHIADEEISIGDYILSGGELPAAIIIEAVARFVSGVLGNNESVDGRPYPVYTRPEEFVLSKKKAKVPKVLLSGNHKKIEEWRKGKI